MCNRKTALLLGAGLLLTSCNTPVDKPPYTDPAFGEATYRNIAVQRVNPPPLEVPPLPPSDGVRRALMIERYQTDKVEQPLEEFTVDED